MCCTDLDASVLPWEDPRWERLRSGVDCTANLRDHFCGALIGGAIGDAIGQGNERVVYVVTFIDCWCKGFRIMSNAAIDTLREKLVWGLRACREGSGSDG